MRKHEVFVRVMDNGQYILYRTDVSVKISYTWPIRNESSRDKQLDKHLKGQCHAILVKLQSTNRRLCINEDQKIML